MDVTVKGRTFNEDIVEKALKARGHWPEDNPKAGDIYYRKCGGVRIIIFVDGELRAYGMDGRNWINLLTITRTKWNKVATISDLSKMEFVK